jgi:uncharacterized protein (TIGR03083 family)
MTAMAAETYDLRTLLDAWEQTLRGVSMLGRVITPEQWEAPTECPGWSAGDVVRHLSWAEAFVAGRRDPEHEMDWSRFPHVDGDFARMTETGVDVRRAQSQVECCDELDGLLDLRLAQIMALDDRALESEVLGLFGSHVPLERLLRIRIFDAWTHLQDLRRAVDHPGDLATPGAQVSALQIARSTSFVLARSIEAPAGTTFRVTVTGPIAFERWAGIDDDLRGVDIDAVSRPDTATIAVDTDWETYARLGAGRLDITDPEVRERATVTGAPELAPRVLESLAITP